MKLTNIVLNERKQTRKDHKPCDSLLGKNKTVVLEVRIVVTPGSEIVPERGHKELSECCQCCFLMYIHTLILCAIKILNN